MGDVVGEAHRLVAGVALHQFHRAVAVRQIAGNQPLLGIDALALNIGLPDAWWALDAIEQAPYRFLADAVRATPA